MLVENKVVNFEQLTKKQQEAFLDIIKQEEITNYTVKVFDDHEKENNFLEKIIKIQIEGTDKNNDKIVKKLVLKIATSVKETRGIVPILEFYKTEIMCYSKILPVLKHLQDKYIKDDNEKFHFINCYKMHSIEFEEFLIMDDVTEEGYALEPRNKTLSLQHMILAIKNISYYHSLSFALRKHCPELFQQFSKMYQYNCVFIEKIDYFFDIILNHTIRCVSNIKIKKILEDLVKDIVNKLINCVAPSVCAPYEVFCHGDCWQNNTMFNSQGGKQIDVMFLDWQISKFCSPNIDLLHMLFSTFDQKAHYKELLDLYYNTLRTQLAKLDCDIEDTYPEHVYREHMKLVAPYGLVYSILSANLLVREGEDIPDTELLFKSGKPHASALDIKDKKCVEHFAKRPENIINDFIEIGLVEYQKG